jgi:hypothetical protein
MNLLTSESTITQKIIEFMEELSNGDSVSLRFWVELRSVMQQNMYFFILYKIEELQLLISSQVFELFPIPQQNNFKGECFRIC